MDAPLSIGSWRPENSDKKYYGEVTLKYALAKSLNLATINLTEQLPRNKIIRNARKMGITTPIQKYTLAGIGNV
ncbi:MAG: hypothetical protein ACLU99_00720 [Alphaproteobacteria bacterium]